MPLLALAALSSPSARAETGGAEPVHTEAARGESARAGPARDEAGRASPARAREPTLLEAQQAAAKRAAGAVEEDESRLSRARAAHWAPVLRAQAQLKDDARTRRGEVRLAPLLEDDLESGHSYVVSATWDLAQLVYTRDENQLALAHMQLARTRQQAAEQVGRLYASRIQKRRAVEQAAHAGLSQRFDAALDLLRLTAELDALTGGLFREALELAQAALDQLTNLPLGE